MCGIFGSVHVKDTDESLCSILHQRGPDGRGHYHDNESSVFLGHNRLSIIDLSPAGKQPMCNEDESVWITFNGEIYNYQELRPGLERKGHIFKSDTDTEVIIHAYEEWGKECLHLFNGMFAFCIWDCKGQTLFLARDRLGIKPLYYSDDGGKFIFGSEPKVILSHPGFSKEIAYPALISFLVYRYISGEQSIWKGIKKLLPGHSLTYDTIRRSSIVDRYWALNPRPKAWTENDAVEKFDELFSSAVKYRLISDVPVGVFLSGGMDSSAISTAASGFSPNINTFSIGFSGHQKSELSDALVVADHLGTNHHQKKVGAGNIDGLKDVFSYMDEPLGDSSLIPTYLVCREGKQHAKVILAGDGGDELLGGYNWYTQFQRQMMMKPISLMLAPVFGLMGKFGKNLYSLRDEFEIYRQLTSPRFTLDEIRMLFPRIRKEQFPSSENYVLKKHYRGDLEPHKRWQYVDALTFMTDDILTKVDRASMANSLEVRVPFLDHRLVEFAFSLPDNLCIRKGKKKYVLRQFLKDRVPSSILRKKKQGFSCPVTSYWPVEKMVQGIDQGTLIQNGILSRTGWENLKEQPKIPYREAKIWMIAVLEKWSVNWLN